MCCVEYVRAASLVVYGVKVSYKVAIKVAVVVLFPFSKFDSRAC